jgi:hypothetical protein
MSDVDKMLDRLPFGEGTIRRSFIAGLIFVFVFALAVLVPLPAPGTTQLAGVDFKDLIQSTQLLVVAVGFVFAVGAIIDAMADGFVIRGVSTVFNLQNWLFDRVARRPAWRYWTWVAVTILLTFLLWPAAIIVATVFCSAGFHWLYRLPLASDSAKLLSDRAAEIYRDDKRIPPDLRRGLEEPFGDKFEAAWQALINLVAKSYRPWVSQLASRNRDLTSYLASILFALAIASALHLAVFGLILPGVIIYLLTCLFAWLFFGCFSLVRRTILSVIELVAITHCLKAGSPKSERGPKTIFKVEISQR